jgi:hypothetical protein
VSIDLIQMLSASRSGGLEDGDFGVSLKIVICFLQEVLVKVFLDTVCSVMSQSCFEGFRGLAYVLVALVHFVYSSM